MQECLKGQMTLTGFCLEKQATFSITCIPPLGVVENNNSPVLILF